MPGTAPLHIGVMVLSSYTAGVAMKDAGAAGSVFFRTLLLEAFHAE